MRTPAGNPVIPHLERRSQYRKVEGVTMRPTSIKTLAHFKEVLLDALDAHGMIAERRAWREAQSKFFPNIHEEDLNSIIDTLVLSGSPKPIRREEW